MTSTERMCVKPHLHDQPMLRPTLSSSSIAQGGGGGGGYSHFFFIRRLDPLSTVYHSIDLENQAYPKVYLKF